MTRPYRSRDGGCEYDGCGRPIQSARLCRYHYDRNTQSGSPQPPGPRPTVEERFWAKVTLTSDGSGCWNWTGALGQGYGRFGVAAGNVVLAYRWLWQQMNGPVPDGLQLDHLCRNRRCVNPAHLEPVTPQENVARGISWQRSKTHCKYGHPFTAENTHVSAKGHRYCRTCYRARAARYREEARHASPAA